MEELEPGEQVIAEEGISGWSGAVAPGTEGVVISSTPYSMGENRYAVKFRTPTGDKYLGEIGRGELRRHNPGSTSSQTPLFESRAPPSLNRLVPEAGADAAGWAA